VPKGFAITTAVADALEAAGRDLDELPLGAVLAICRLADCIPITPWSKLPGPFELVLGDYRHGRYMWVLENVLPFSRPLPARGRLGLWNWTPPEELAGVIWPCIPLRDRLRLDALLASEEESA
jgi:hypothetical protein